MSNTQVLKDETGNRHLRTIGKAAEWLQQIDEGTPVRYSTIRSAVLSEKLPAVNVGTKKLVVLEEVYRYFYGAEIDPSKLSV